MHIPVDQETSTLIWEDQINEQMLKLAPPEGPAQISRDPWPTWRQRQFLKLTLPRRKSMELTLLKPQLLMSRHACHTLAVALRKADVQHRLPPSAVKQCAQEVDVLSFCLSFAFLQRITM